MLGLPVYQLVQKFKKQSRIGVLVNAVAMLLLCSCITEGPETKKIKKLPPPPEDARIEQLHLWSLPVGVNLDGKTGPDGFSVKVYASSPDYPKPVAFNKGFLEIMMFDGAGDDAEDQPLKIWKFEPRDLQQFAAVSTIGVSYELVLPWEKAAPKKKNISIVARYTPPNGRVVVAPPTSIFVADKTSKQ